MAILERIASKIAGKRDVLAPRDWKGEDLASWINAGVLRPAGFAPEDYVCTDCTACDTFPRPKQKRATGGEPAFCVRCAETGELMDVPSESIVKYAIKVESFAALFASALQCQTARPSDELHGAWDLGETGEAFSNRKRRAWFLRRFDSVTALSFSSLPSGSQGAVIVAAKVSKDYDDTAFPFVFAADELMPYGGPVVSLDPIRGRFRADTDRRRQEKKNLRKTDADLEDNLKSLAQYYKDSANALVSVNVEHLLTNWEIGGYLFAKIKYDGWGKSTIDSLVDYIRTHAPDERGYGRSNLYSMVAVYDEFTSPDFTALVARYGNRIVQPLAGQFEGKFIQPVAGQISGLPNVQPAAAQIIPMPDVLAFTTFTNIVEILNRTRTAHERLFYIIYAFRERLKKMELRRCLVNDTYSSLLGGDKKNFSKALVASYPDSPVLFRDSAFVDFLNLPEKHSEKRLRRGIVANMKDFILSIGKDFLFVGEEFPVKVGGTEFNIDLLFFHRRLQCLVAFELKARNFKPSDMGQLEFYLEALDRDVKMANENPSVGVLLCKNADRSVVEYALSRSMSPAMVAEYKRLMIPKDVLQETYDCYIGMGEEKGGVK